MSGAQASILVQLMQALECTRDRLQRLETQTGDGALRSDLTALQLRLQQQDRRTQITALADEIKGLSAQLKNAAPATRLQALDQSLNEMNDRVLGLLSVHEQEHEHHTRQQINFRQQIEARLREQEMRYVPDIRTEAFVDLSHRTAALERRRQAKTLKGDDGTNGLTPLFRMQQKAGRIVLEVYHWIDTDDQAPPTGYLGNQGVVDDVRQATDLRGAAGVSYGGGGLSEAEVMALIEAGMSPTPDVEYPRLVTTVTETGDTTLITPGEGQALRIRRIKCTSDPDVTDTPLLTLRVGSKDIQQGPVLYGSDYVEGAMGDALVLNVEAVSGAVKVAANIHYEEFTP